MLNHLLEEQCHLCVVGVGGAWWDLPNFWSRCWIQCLWGWNSYSQCHISLPQPFYANSFCLTPTNAFVSWLESNGDVEAIGGVVSLSIFSWLMICVKWRRYPHTPSGWSFGKSFWETCGNALLQVCNSMILSSGVTPNSISNTIKST